MPLLQGRALTYHVALIDNIILLKLYTQPMASSEPMKKNLT